MKRLIALLITMSVVFSFAASDNFLSINKEELKENDPALVTSSQSDLIQEENGSAEEENLGENSGENSDENSGKNPTSSKETEKTSKKNSAGEKETKKTSSSSKVSVTTTKRPSSVKGSKYTLPSSVPSSFSVGYAAVDISGDPSAYPTKYYGGTATGVHDPLLLTCIAVWDGEDIALIMTADLKKMFEDVADRSFEIIETKFGIPEKNIIISCTHTHAAPDAGASGNGNAQWLANYYAKLPIVVENAIRDLDPVEKAFTGKANQYGIGFVRRYLLADGTWKMNPSASMNPIAHESEADPEMRTIRFDRKNKKDVLLVNFQTHYYGANNWYKNQFSADFVAPFRESAQREFDCLFAYYSGASGDINQVAKLESDKAIKVADADQAFMDGARKCLLAEKEVSVGKINFQHSEYFADCMVRSAERVSQARKVQAAGTDTAKGKALMAQYGFVDDNDVSFTIYYKDLSDYQYVPFNAIAFGDIAFVSASYEMFHENASYVRRNSPFETTFVCTLSHAANGYVPTKIGYEHGSYETFNCRFVAGSGELFANEMVRLLRACK